MNGTMTAITVITCILACAGVCILMYRIGWTDGYDAGRDYEQDRQARKRLRETRSDSVIASKTSLGGADGHPPWYVTVTPRRAVAMPGTPLAALFTLPGGYRPAHPPRRATDTGELRALAAATDHFVMRLEAEGAAWREQAAAR